MEELKKEIVVNMITGKTFVSWTDGKHFASFAFEDNNTARIGFAKLCPIEERPPLYSVIMFSKGRFLQLNQVMFVNVPEDIKTFAKNYWEDFQEQLSIMIVKNML